MDEISRTSFWMSCATGRNEDNPALRKWKKSSVLYNLHKADVIQSDLGLLSIPPMAANKFVKNLVCMYGTRYMISMQWRWCELM